MPSHTCGRPKVPVRTGRLLQPLMCVSKSPIGGFTQEARKVGGVPEACCCSISKSQRSKCFGRADIIRCKIDAAPDLVSAKRFAPKLICDGFGGLVWWACAKVYPSHTAWPAPSLPATFTILTKSTWLCGKAASSTCRCCASHGPNVDVGLRGWLVGGREAPPDDAAASEPLGPPAATAASH